MLEVAMVTGALGLGGTEKGLVEHALAFDPAAVHVRVVTIDGLGPRAEDLRRAGIAVTCAEGDGDRLRDALRGADVVHVFRAGLAEPLLPAARRAADVPVLVETNVFGAVDASADEGDFACHLFVSRMCALRYRTRLGLDGPDFHRRHRVSHWPLALERMRVLSPPPAQARVALGLDPDRPVVCRIGRADDRKWRDLLVAMMPALLELVPDCQLLIVGATPRQRRRLARHGVEHAVTVMEPTSDEAELMRIYAAADVFVTAAEIGESYSVAISEAMGLGLPVVTCSTPRVDNGQIEQVDHGETGFVADHPRAFAEAVAAIVDDPALRASMSRAAAAKADRLMDAPTLTRQLVGLYEDLLAHRPVRAAWTPALAEVDAFAAEYPARLVTRRRPLTRRERLEVRLADRRELVRWGWRAARSMDRAKLRMALGIVRGRLRARPGARPSS